MAVGLTVQFGNRAFSSSFVGAKVGGGRLENNGKPTGLCDWPRAAS